MKEVRVLEIKESVFADNDRQADNLRRELKEQGVFLMNLMSSPGSGKTTTLKGTIERLKDRFRIGVMEADIDSDVDAKAIAETGVKSIQLHTGGMCHLDAEMTRQGVEGLGVADVDLAILENVGNLVCPAEFDTGASKNVMILSVPEGHDKPLKYPLMFQICDAVLINKIDVLPYFDFDMERAGWFASILGEYKMDYFTPGILFWYASGDDSNPFNGSERMPSIEGSWTASSYGFDDNYGRVACDMLGLSNDGKMGVYLQAKDISFMEDLTHIFRGGFIKGTNNTEMARTYEAAFANDKGRQVYLTTAD